MTVIGRCELSPLKNSVDIKVSVTLISNSSFTFRKFSLILQSSNYEYSGVLYTLLLQEVHGKKLPLWSKAVAFRNPFYPYARNLSWWRWSCTVIQCVWSACLFSCSNQNWRRGIGSGMLIASYVYNLKSRKVCFYFCTVFLICKYIHILAINQ